MAVIAIGHLVPGFAPRSRRTVLVVTDHWPMAGRRSTAHRASMAEIVLLICTGLAFLVLVAGVAIEVDEERRDERELHAHARGHKP